MKPAKKRVFSQAKEDFIFRRRFVSANPEKKGRNAFSFKDVEWVRKDKKLTECGFGKIFLGKVKFIGTGPPKRCIIKEFNRLSGTDYKEVVARLNRSLADHPKMAFFVNNGKPYLIQEAFVKGGISKFRASGVGLFEKLDLGNNPEHYDFFRQAVVQIGILAHSGLRISKAVNANGDEFIDVFNSIKLKNGKTKVFVQDIDMIFLENNPKEAWEASTKALLDVVCSDNWHNRKYALGIIEMIGARFGFVV